MSGDRQRDFLKGPGFALNYGVGPGVIAGLDYSQIEMRMAAAYSEFRHRFRKRGPHITMKLKRLDRRWKVDIKFDDGWKTSGSFDFKHLADAIWWMDSFRVRHA